MRKDHDADLYIKNRNTFTIIIIKHHYFCGIFHDVLAALEDSDTKLGLTLIIQSSLLFICMKIDIIFLIDVDKHRKNEPSILPHDIVLFFLDAKLSTVANTRHDNKQSSDLYWLYAAVCTGAHGEYL